MVFLTRTKERQSYKNPSLSVTGIFSGTDYYFFKAGFQNFERRFILYDTPLNSKIFFLKDT